MSDLGQTGPLGGVRLEKRTDEDNANSQVKEHVQGRSQDASQQDDREVARGPTQDGSKTASTGDEEVGSETKDKGTHKAQGNPRRGLEVSPEEVEYGGLAEASGGANSVRRLNVSLSSDGSIVSTGTTEEDLYDMFTSDPRRLIEKARALVRSVAKRVQTWNPSDDAAPAYKRRCAASAKNANEKLLMYSKVMNDLIQPDDTVGEESDDILVQMEPLISQCESVIHRLDVRTTDDIIQGEPLAQSEDPIVMTSPGQGDGRREVLSQQALEESLDGIQLSQDNVTLRGRQGTLFSERETGARPKTSFMQRPVDSQVNVRRNLDETSIHQLGETGLRNVANGIYQSRDSDLRHSMRSNLPRVLERSINRDRGHTRDWQAGAGSLHSTPAQGESQPPRRSVRFSSIQPREQVEDMYGNEDPYDMESRAYQDDIGEYTWRTYRHDTTNITELAVIDILKSVAKITNIELNEELGDVEISALDARERISLKELRTELEKKVEKNISSEMKKHAVSAFKASSEWLEELDMIVKERKLHLKPDHRYAKPLELDKFTGHKDPKTNVYEFLRLYEIISRGFTMEHKAHFLYNNYLDNDVKATVRHLRENYSLLKKNLVMKYGDVDRLLANKRNIIKELSVVTVRSTDQQKLIYIKQFREVLEQIQTLVDLNNKDYPAMEAEIFSHSNVMGLATLLPKFLQEKFTSKYVKKRELNAGYKVPGKEMFILLLGVLSKVQGAVEFSLEAYAYEPVVKREETKKFNNFSGDQRDKQRKKPDGPRKMKPPCFVHNEYKKFEECPIGKCSTFLNMKPKDRLTWAVKKGICLECLKWFCATKSPGKCIYGTQFSQVLICDQCKAMGASRNVLICGDHNNDTQTVRDALKDFLHKFDDGTAITMNKMTPTIELKQTTVLKSTQVENKETHERRENTNAFDIETGKLVPKIDVRHRTNEDSKDYAIYPMQTLNVSGERTLVLYDSGAMGEAIKAQLAEKVKMSIIDSKPQSFRVAGGDVVHTNNPLYEGTFGPDIRGEYHTFSLLGMDQISEALPAVDLRDMGKEFKKNQVSSPLSKEELPLVCGGSEIQLIIGIRQSLLFPSRILVLDSGLQVWRSQLKDVFGSTLIFAGPHASVRRAYSMLNMTSEEDTLSLLFSRQYNLYRQHLVVEALEIDLELNRRCLKEDEVNSLTPVHEMGTEEAFPESDHVEKLKEENGHSTAIILTSIHVGRQDNDAVALLEPNEDMLKTTTEAKCPPCNKCTHCEPTILVKARNPRSLEKLFKEEEEVGCTVDYRCTTCAACTICKASERLRPISIREEAEEALIAKTTKTDFEEKRTTCVYPFTELPEEYLPKRWGGANNNYKMAESVLKSQRNKSAEIRESVLRFHDEVHKKGFVARLIDLPENVQREIEDSAFKHYFCWRSVFKAGSVSTPARLVVDPTVSSFNDILAKGVNCLTSLYMIAVEWRSHIHAFTSDISKMFNSLKLEPEMYKYSLYLFSEKLEPGEHVETWVNLTLMYGLVSAANQCTHALRKIAEVKKDEYPLAYEVITRTTYMDDSSGGSNDKDTFDKLVGEMKELLPLGGFNLKVVTCSGDDPCEKASADGVATTFAGYKWKSKEDKLLLNSSDLNFNKKRRGIKRPNEFPINTEEDVDRLLDGRKLTRRNLLGKTLEMFDVLGLWEPLKVRLKLDLQPLKDLDYDDEIPDNMRPRWVENLKLLHGAKQLECRRAFVPENAIDPDKIELLVCSDAAVSMAGCAIYARYKLKDGTYSCQLITARSKTTQASIPRNELEGCSLAAQTAFTVARSFGDKLEDLIFATDSTISVCWISNPDNKLKQFVNARVKLIHRLVGDDRFYHIAGVNNPADLLTRGDITCDDITEDSRWQKGDPWMTLSFEEMPLKSYAEICSGLTNADKEAIERESHPTIPASLKHTQEIGQFRVAPQPLALPDSDGQFCCEAEMRKTECHCKSAKCCICIFREEPVTISDQFCQVKAHCPMLMKISPKEKPEKQENENAYLVDFVKFGFERAMMQLSYVMRFVMKLKHKVHLRKGQDTSEGCQLCSQSRLFKTQGLDKLNLPEKRVEVMFADPKESQPVPGPRVVVCSPLDTFMAWRYLCTSSTACVKSEYNDKPKKLAEFEERDGILFGAGRLSHPSVLIRNEEDIKLFNDMDYLQPVFLANDSLTYAISMYAHWVLCPHSGVERTMSTVLRIIHVEKLRKVIKFIRETCPRCRYLLKKHYTPATGNQSLYSVMRAPPFFACMIDIAGTFEAHDSIKMRVKKDSYFLVQVCLVTGAVAIGVLEDLTTSSIIMAISRTAFRYGWSKYLIADNQSSFKTLESLKISYKDLKGKLWRDQKIILDFSTPLAHNEHGRVESKIKILKDYLKKSGELGKKHSFVEWETIGMSIASAINGLPICHNQDDPQADDTLGLLTPNMFLIGRNNSRAPEGFAEFEHNPVRAIKQLAEMNTLLLDLLGDYVHRFIPGKRVADGNAPEVDDVVLFVIKEAERTRNVKYRFGRVIKIDVDGRQNKVRIRYRNAAETVFREVDRQVKDVVLIQGSEELDFNSREHCLAASIQQKYL